MPPVSASAPHILIADVDADVRTYIAGCLRIHTEVHMSQAADGREALFLARALRPALVIAGFRMPGLDGVSLCRALRADPPTSGIPVLLVWDEAPDETAGDGGLVKPFNASHLRVEVERLLGKPLRPRLPDSS